MSTSKHLDGQQKRITSEMMPSKLSGKNNHLDKPEPGRGFSVDENISDKFSFYNHQLYTKVI